MTDGPAQREGHRRAALRLAIAATFLAILSTNIVNLALPHMMRAFGADVATIEWVVTSYLLTFSLGLPVSGWASDRFGRTPVFQVALGIFVAGALLAGLAPTLPVLVAGRVIQAAGASALAPTALALVHDHFEPHERGRALGLWAFGATLGPALGPSLGGFLADNVGWRSIFFLYVPAGLVVLALTRSGLGARRPAPGGGAFDVRGLASLAALFAGTHLAINRLSHQGPTTESALGAGLAALGFLGLLRGPRAGLQPLVDLGTFARRDFSFAVALGALRAFALFGSVFLLPIYLQRVAGLDALHAALLMLPTPLTLAACSPIAGRLTGRIPTRVLASAGVLIVAGSLLLLSSLSAQAPMARVLISQALRGAGVALLIAPVMAAALNDMPTDRVGSASGLLSIIMQIGGALGVAVLSGVLTRAGAAFGVDPSAPTDGDQAARAFAVAFAAAGGFCLLGLVPALGLSARPLPPAPPAVPVPGD